MKKRTNKRENGSLAVYGNGQSVKHDNYPELTKNIQKLKMTKKIKSLLHNGRVLEVNLSNCDYLVSLYLKQLNEFETYHNQEMEREKSNWFRNLFNYYQNNLIPALEESLRLDEKHLELIKKNPDSNNFQPVRIEIRHHKKLMNQFFRRFEQIHREFLEYCHNVESQNNER